MKRRFEMDTIVYREVNEANEEIAVITEQTIRDDASPFVTMTTQRDPYNMNSIGYEYYCVCSVPVKYSYVVEGKTEDVSFSFSSDTYSTRFTIPVIGLYISYLTTIRFTFEALDGSTSERIFMHSISPIVIGDVKPHIDIERLDETIAGSTIDNGWLMTSWGNAYDKNGDLRIAGVYEWGTTPLRTHRFYDENKYGADKLYFICGETLVGWYYTYRLYSTNLVGKVDKLFAMPSGYIAHHDACWNASGYYMYALTGIIENPTLEEMLEAHIAKINTTNNTVVWNRDYSRYFQNANVLANSDALDVHFNCLDYNDDLGLFVTCSRSTSTILGIRESDGEIVWTVDDPTYNDIVPEANLTVINPDNFIYANGPHTAGYTYNSKYDAYRGDNKFVITIYNNNSCLNEDGTPNMTPITSPQGDAAFAAEIDSEVLVYAIDLNARTVEMVDRFTFPGERSPFRANVFDNGDNFDVFHCDVFSFYTIDAENTVGIHAPAVEEVTSYRARIFTYDELRSLLW